MKLNELFETQKKLDARIVEEKGLEGQDLLPEKILALLTELGELSNEWRGFKFWSEDREPRTHARRYGKRHIYYNPLLEEYVDCLHFILSIGLEIGEEYFILDEGLTAPQKNITNQFQKVFGYAYLVTTDDYCTELLTTFIQLGEMLGFSWNQIESAYYHKNEINHERQNRNY